MKSRSWKLNLVAGICFGIATLISLIETKYSSVFIYSICGLIFFISSRKSYKKYKNG